MTKNICTGITRMKSKKKIMELLYWVGMAGLFFWFAYNKGWIFANFTSIDAKQAVHLIETDDNLTILDVRTIPEFKEGHLADATLIPLDMLEQNLDKLKSNKDKKILVYCRSGNRSVSASRILETHGFTPVNVKGGIIDLAMEKAQIVR